MWLVAIEIVSIVGSEVIVIETESNIRTDIDDTKLMECKQPSSRSQSSCRIVLMSNESGLVKKKTCGQMDERIRVSAAGRSSATVVGKNNQRGH